MKKIYYIIILFLALGTFIFAWGNYTGSRVKKFVPSVEIENKIVSVEIAATAAEQIQGLSDRATLQPDSGLLFVFPDKRPRSFWMKNMKFPIDIIWIRGDEVVRIDANLPPAGERPETTYDSAVPVDRVLEVNSGFAALNNFHSGSKVIYNLVN